MPLPTSAVPPPIRRRAVASAPIAYAPSASLPSSVPLRDSIGISRPRTPPAGPVDDFNGGLYCLKAFGYATAAVFAGGMACVWGVKTYMGVKDVRLLLNTHT